MKKSITTEFFFSDTEKKYIRDNYNTLSDYHLAKNLTSMALDGTVITKYKVKVFLKSESLVRTEKERFFASNNKYFNVDSKHCYGFLIGKADGL